MNIIKRFWKYVDKQGPIDCWEWTGAIRKGYGLFVINYKNESAHRVSWAIAHKTWPVPEGMICHTCDNRGCVNPAHLYLGTNTTNQQDASPLTPKDVREIRQLRKERYTQTEIGNMYGVTQVAISNICSYERWADV